MAGLDPAIQLRAHAMSRAFVKETSESARSGRSPKLAALAARNGSLDRFAR
jgi:hypothetical protein